MLLSFKMAAFTCFAYSVMYFSIFSHVKYVQHGTHHRNRSCNQKTLCNEKISARYIGAIGICPKKTAIAYLAVT